MSVRPRSHSLSQLENEEVVAAMNLMAIEQQQSIAPVNQSIVVQDEEVVPLQVNYNARRSLRRSLSTGDDGLTLGQLIDDEDDY